MIYLSLTVLGFAFGPWKYPIDNAETLYTFLIAVQVALAAGYLLILNLNKSPKRSTYLPNLQKLLLIGLALSSVNQLFLLRERMIAGKSNDLLDIISRINEVYVEVLRSESSPFDYLRIFLAPITAFSAVASIFYRNRSSKVLFYATVFFWVLEILTNIVSGKRDGVITILITVPWIFIASHYSGLSRITSKNVISLLCLASFGFVCFLWYFTHSHEKRIGENFVTNLVTQQVIDPDHFVNMLPQNLRAGAVGAFFYFSGGYYPLAKALEKDFVPCYGGGHSLFLIRQVSKWLAPDFIERTYPFRLYSEDGIYFLGVFTTAYTYFASDVTFPGVILVMLLLGMLICASWLDAIYKQNPWAMNVFIQSILIVFHLPGFNFVTGDHLVTFWASLAAWLYSRKKYGRLA
jgi:hypothetical protein